MKSKITSKITIWEDFSQNIGKSIIHTEIRILGIPISRSTDISASYADDNDTKKAKAGFLKNDKK